MAPDVAASQPGPGFGQGMQSAQDSQGKDPIEMAVQTCEKLLSGINDDTFKPYAQKAIASLKVGLGMVKQKQPGGQQGMQGPPQGGGQAPPPKGPPTPGQMPV
jgi:hypothetical protein